MMLEHEVKCVLKVSGPRYERSRLFHLMGENKGRHQFSLELIYPMMAEKSNSAEDIITWRSKHWGTTGIIGDQIITADTSKRDYFTIYEFSTYSSPPSGVIKILGIRFPNLHFHCAFKGDSFKGSISVYDGEYFRDEEELPDPALAEIASMEALANSFHEYLPGNIQALKSGP
jgi:hypothetical protein